MQNALKMIAKRIRRGELSIALTESKKSLDAGDRNNQKLQCFLLLKNQKYPEADGLCTKLLNSGLDHELLCWRGIARSELGLWHSALIDLRLSQELFPQYATEQRIDHTTHRACQNISEGMQLEGGNFPDFFERAKIYLLNQDYSRAARDLKSAIDLKPEVIGLKKLQAEIDYQAARFKESLAQIETFLEAEPDDLDAILLKARIKADTGRLRAGLAILRQASKSNQRDELTQLRIANCRVAIRDFHGAIRDFDATIDINPKSVGAFYGRGKANLEIRRFDAALTDFQQALELGGKNAIFYVGLGEAKLAKALKKDASSNFKVAMEIEPKCWQAKLGYAKVKNMRAKRSEALKIANDLLKKHDSNHQIYQFLGTVYFDEQDFVSAATHFTAAIEHCRTSFEAASCYYQRGTARLENQQVPEAINDFDNALKRRPFHVGTLVWRGYAHGKLGKWAAAIRDLQAAIDMNPMAADQYKKLGDYIAEHAIKHFGAVIRENKSDPGAYFSRGMANLFLANQDKAYLDFEQTLELDPNHGEARVRLGMLYLKDNQSKKAYNFFSEAMKSQPSSNTLLLRAEAMLQLGVIQPALLDIRDAIRNSLDNDRLYVRRGELYLAKDNLEKALDDFTLSIALNFDNFQAFRHRGRLFAKKGLAPEAIRDLTMSLHFYPKQPDLLFERGELYLSLEKFEEAAEDFEAALAYGHDLASYIGRAKAIVGMKRGQEALVWLTKAIHRFQTHQEWAQLVKARSEVFLSLGRFERASADARIASKLNPEPKFAADCYYLRALCSFLHRDRDHAIKTLEKAINLDENHEKAELALDWFKEMADAPPEEWQSPPEKVRPTRPKAIASVKKISIDQDAFEIEAPMDLWLVKQQDEEFGPIPLKKIVDWANEGRIGPETMLFRTDWGKWKMASKIIPQIGGKSPLKNAIPRVSTPPEASR